MSFNNASGATVEDTLNLTITNHYEATQTSRKYFSGWDLSFNIDGQETSVFLADTTDEDYLKTGQYIEIDTVAERLRNAFRNYPQYFRNEASIQAAVGFATTEEIDNTHASVMLDAMVAKKLEPSPT